MPYDVSIPSTRRSVIETCLDLVFRSCRVLFSLLLVRVFVHGALCVSLRLSSYFFAAIWSSNQSCMVFRAGFKLRHPLFACKWGRLMSPVVILASEATRCFSFFPRGFLSRLFLTTIGICCCRPLRADANLWDLIYGIVASG
jgi:hypothetical protein